MTRLTGDAVTDRARAGYPVNQADFGESLQSAVDRGVVKDLPGLRRPPPQSSTA